MGKMFHCELAISNHKAMYISDKKEVIFFAIWITNGCNLKKRLPSINCPSMPEVECTEKYFLIYGFKLSND